MTDSTNYPPPKRGKLAQLEAEIRKSRVTGFASDDERAHWRAHYLKSDRYIGWHMRRSFRYADDEISNQLIENNRDLYETGFVDRNTQNFVFERFGWPCLSNGWSIVPQERFGERKPPMMPTVERNARGSVTKTRFNPAYSDEYIAANGAAWDLMRQQHRWAVPVPDLSAVVATIRQRFEHVLDIAANTSTH